MERRAAPDAALLLRDLPAAALRFLEAALLRPAPGLAGAGFLERFEVLPAAVLDWAALEEAAFATAALDLAGLFLAPVFEVDDFFVCPGWTAEARRTQTARTANFRKRQLSK